MNAFGPWHDHVPHYKAILSNVLDSQVTLISFHLGCSWLNLCLNRSWILYASATEEPSDAAGRENFIKVCLTDMKSP